MIFCMMGGTEHLEIVQLIVVAISILVMDDQNALVAIPTDATCASVVAKCPPPICHPVPAIVRRTHRAEGGTTIQPLRPILAPSAAKLDSATLGVLELGEPALKCLSAKSAENFAAPAACHAGTG